MLGCYEKFPQAVAGRDFEDATLVDADTAEESLVVQLFEHDFRVILQDLRRRQRRIDPLKI